MEHYQVPVVFRREAAEQLAHAFIGSVTDQDGGEPIELYDALHDKEVTGRWLEAIAEQLTVDGVSFVRDGEVAEIPVDQPSLALTAEQSNTSLVFGDAAIMKVFRRLEPGLNPDIEIHAAFGKVGGRHVAKLLGHVNAEIDGQPWSLAMLQEFMTTATDGWQLATNSVRDLMAEADLHAAEAGGDFAAEAFRLGVSTAEVHADLVAGLRHLDADRGRPGRTGRRDEQPAGRRAGRGAGAGRGGVRAAAGLHRVRRPAGPGAGPADPR